MGQVLPVALGRGTGLLQAANPGEMTLDGTNTYVVFDPSVRFLQAGTPVIVVDPGPDLDEHVAALAQLEVQLVLITHRHADHTEAIDHLHELTGAPVRAWLPEHCRQAPVLADGEVISAAGTSLSVLHTPGHTSDSVCLVRTGAGAGLFSGDTILGRGTTIIDFPDGTLADYLHSLGLLANLLEAQDLPLRPGHGEQRAGARQIVAQYQAHRASRLEQVRAALAQLGQQAGTASTEAVLELVYPGLEPRLVPAATHSLQAQLHYLAAARH